MSKPDQIDMMSEYELRIELMSVIQQLIDYRKAFEHVHVNSQDGTDVCKKCGLDLRNLIHKRAM